MILFDVLMGLLAVFLVVAGVIFLYQGAKAIIFRRYVAKSTRRFPNNQPLYGLDAVLVGVAIAFTGIVFISLPLSFITDIQLIDTLAGSCVFLPFILIFVLINVSNRGDRKKKPE